MNEIVYAGNQALYIVAILSMPPVLVATLVGLVVGLMQTVTQLQEQTLPFGLKLIAVGFCLYLLSGWFGGTLLDFSNEVFGLAFHR